MTKHKAHAALLVALLLLNACSTEQAEDTRSKAAPTDHYSKIDTGNEANAEGSASLALTYGPVALPLTISGRIIDKDTKAPLAGVNVNLNGLGNVVTNADGSYSASVTLNVMMDQGTDNWMLASRMCVTKRGYVDYCKTWNFTGKGNYLYSKLITDNFELKSCASVSADQRWITRLGADFYPPTFNTPISASQMTSFITSLYYFYDGRSPTTTHVNFVLDQFVQHYVRLRLLVNDQYKKYLDRNGETQGIEYWREVWRQNRGPEAVMIGILSSQEFYNKAGGSDAAWVKALYEKLLSRSPAASEVSYYVERLQSVARGAVVSGFVNSPESRTNFIKTCYTKYLQREGSQAEVGYWLAEWNAGRASHDWILAVFTSTDAYKNLVVEVTDH